MKKMYASLFAFASFAAGAQTVTSTFESLALGADTFYNAPVSQSWTDGGCKFQYKKSGSYWTGGFAYTNKRDSSTAGFTNLYGIKAYAGRNSSAKWAIGQQMAVVSQTLSSARFEGLYMTNTTFAYKSMKNGDSFAKKFGGATGNDPDFLKVHIKGYANGAAKDSVEFMLADFRFSDNTKDYILKTWEYVDLSKLGKVDSLMFVMYSSDNDPNYGMNTPGFFAIDDISVVAPFNTAISESRSLEPAVYPNPFADAMTVEADGLVRVVDMQGKVQMEQIVEGSSTIDTHSLPAGISFIELHSAGSIDRIKMIRQ
jgi:hypothetical protein